MAVHVSYANDLDLLIHYGDGSTQDGEIKLLYDQPNGYIRHNNSGTGARVDYPGVNDYTGRMVILSVSHWW